MGREPGHLDRGRRVTGQTIGASEPALVDINPEADVIDADETPLHPDLWTDEERENIRRAHYDLGYDEIDGDFDAWVEKRRQYLGPVEDYAPGVGERGYDTDYI